MTRPRPFAAAGSLLGAGALGFWYGARGWWEVSRAAFPLDDPWIHLSMARNFFSHGTWGLNPGEWSTCSTAPLWTLFTGIAEVLPGSPVVPLQVAGVILLALLGWLTWELGRRWMPGPFAGLLAAALVLTKWELVWAALSGMETVAFTASVAGVLLLQSQGRHRPAALLAGVAGWLRPEALLLVPALAADLLLTSNTVKSRAREALWIAGAYLLLNGPLYALNVTLAGRPFPNTYYAKLDTFLNLRSLYLLGLGSQVFTPLMTLAIVAGLLWLAWKRPSLQPGMAAAFLWGAGHAAVYFWHLPGLYHHMRYVLPLVFLGVLAAEGAVRLLPGKAVHVAAAALLLGWNAVLLPEGAVTFTHESANIEEVQGRMAAWVREQVPEGRWVATDDIGRIAYDGGHPVLDLRGLVQPGINTSFAAGRRNLATELAKRPVHGLAIYSKYYGIELQALPIQYRAGFQPPYPPGPERVPFQYFELVKEPGQQH